MIRPATPDDADAIWDIFQKVVAGRDTYVFPPDTPRDEALVYWLGEKVISRVAEVDGRVVGMYKLIENHGGLGAHVANASFMVDPLASGRGIGYAMGGDCLREARRQGYEAMQFNFVVSTNARAVELWRRLGFRVVGTLPRVFRHGTLGLVDALIMYRELDDIPLSFGTPPENGTAITRPSAYAVVTKARDEIAIVQAKEGMLLPGGGIDAGESAEDAAVREVAEECGLAVDITGNLGEAIQFVTSTERGATFGKRSRFVSARVRSTIHGATPEHTTRWLNIGDALETVTYESHAWAIRRWQRLES
jgi:ribosomal protein S18 acetylase RimI-like enzyme/8-oxo-dGTP pyrophosphatase MutT (NUDIX family)